MAALVAGGQDGRDDPAAIGWPRTGDISPAFFARNGPTEFMRSFCFFHYRQTINKKLKCLYGCILTRCANAFATIVFL
jgi:hypothetical protein